jgi:hypothetical protein
MRRIAVVVAFLAVWLVYALHSHLPPQITATVAVVLAGTLVGFVDSFSRNYVSASVCKWTLETPLDWYPRHTGADLLCLL